MLALKPSTLCAWVVVTIAAASPQARAQGLADAARQAGEQRKAAEGQPRIKIVAVPEQTLPTVALSRPDVEHYTRLRMAMGQLWHRDLRLYERVRGGVQQLLAILGIFLFDILNDALELSLFGGQFAEPLLT
jgi:hypothetical protein